MVLNFSLIARKTFNHWSLLWLSPVNIQTSKQTQLTIFSTHTSSSVENDKKLTKVKKFHTPFCLVLYPIIKVHSDNRFFMHTLLLKNLC